MTAFDQLLARFRQKGLFLDTNLLVLLLVGRRRPDLIGLHGFKRLAAYTREDFLLLELIQAEFSMLVTTPQILAEVSNLVAQLGGDARRECLAYLQEYIATSTELYVSSERASQRNEFLHLGLADCTMAECAQDYLVLSADARCVARLQASGLQVMNYNHLRDGLTI